MKIKKIVSLVVALIMLISLVPNVVSAVDVELDGSETIYIADDNTEQADDSAEDNDYDSQDKDEENSDEENSDEEDYNSDEESEYDSDENEDTDEDLDEEIDEEYEEKCDEEYYLAPIVMPVILAPLDVTVVATGRLGFGGSAPVWRRYSDGHVVVGSGIMSSGGAGWSTGGMLGYTRTIEFVGPITLRSGATVAGTTHLFLGFNNVTRIDGLYNIDTSNAENMMGTFTRARSLESIDVSTWDTSNVTNMHQMFRETTNLTSLDLSNWDTSSVTNMSEMFGRTTNLTNLELGSWDTSSVTNMRAMFLSAASLASLDLSSWDTSSVTDMNNMFAGTRNLTSLDLSSWDTSNVTNMSDMFSGATSLQQITLGENWVVNFGSHPSLPNNTWRNVGDGTVTNPQGDLILTSSQLMRGNAGAGNTWVWYGTGSDIDIDIDIYHFVEFDMQGGAGGFPLQTVADGDTAVEPATIPTRIGHTFVGWYTAETGGTRFNFSTPITDDTVIYARWQANALITKSAAATVAPNAPLVYTITVHNTNDVALTELVVTDNLPPQLENPRDLLYPAGVTAEFTGQMLFAVIDRLEPNEYATITFTVTVNANAGQTITNTAAVTVWGGGIQGIHDESSATTRVVQPFGNGGNGGSGGSNRPSFDPGPNREHLPGNRIPPITETIVQPPSIEQPVIGIPERQVEVAQTQYPVVYGTEAAVISAVYDIPVAVAGYVADVEPTRIEARVNPQTSDSIGSIGIVVSAVGLLLSLGSAFLIMNRQCKRKSA